MAHCFQASGFGQLGLMAAAIGDVDYLDESSRPALKVDVVG
jgi:hypothetical protein